MHLAHGLYADLEFGPNEPQPGARAAMSKTPIVPMGDDEQRAWDGYIAGALNGGQGWNATVEQAERCLVDRRERQRVAAGLPAPEDQLKKIVRQLREWAKSAKDGPNCQADQPGLGERAKALNDAATALERGL